LAAAAAWRRVTTGMSRQQRRRASRWSVGRSAKLPLTRAYPIWIEVSGRRMFVVGYPPGGAPYGIFEDKMDADPTRTTLIQVTAASGPDSVSCFRSLLFGSADRAAGIVRWTVAWAGLSICR